MSFNIAFSRTFILLLPLQVLFQVKELSRRLHVDGLLREVDALSVADLHLLVPFAFQALV